jgi:hypothetical protein
MKVSAVLPHALLFLVLFPFAASRSFNIDTDFTSSTKNTYPYAAAVTANQDFNGDGFLDVLAYSGGYVYLFFGANTFPATPSVQFTGPGGFGRGCQFVGDVNKDGYADVLLGYVGSATYLILGGPSTAAVYSVLAANVRTITYTPETPVNSGGSTFGVSLTGTGDANKDGFSDFLICDYSLNVGSFNVAGACYLIYGKNNLQSISMSNLGSGGIKISGAATAQQLGIFVSAAGDINNDGYADFLISSGDHNNVYLFYGGGSLTSITATPSSVSSASVGVVFPIPRAGDLFGISVSRAGDFNHDGIDDLLISSPSFSANCVIYVVFGGSSLPTTFNLNTMTSSAGVRYFTNKGDRGGYDARGGVDYNLDGIDDIIIGAAGSNNGNGAAHVVFGSTSPVDSSVFHLGDGVLSLNGTSSASGFGSVVVLVKIGPTSRGIFGLSDRGMGLGALYYFHDFTGTNAPSVSPTTAPTVSPTSPPSASPTADPTFTPSATPTASPTFAPSVSPTVTPTVTPSAAPSFPPTFVPTATPTNEPTVSPTLIPSIIPSVTPTVAPTDRPTVAPTVTPSLVPSVVPSYVPSANPTRNPTFVPSAIPTFRPTVAPTVDPTFVPSFTPTFSPTRTPSFVPTGSPTVTPTHAPTLVPSVEPTVIPSAFPSIVPSFRPSAPTYSPSAVPSAVPTGRTKGSIIVNAGLTVNSVNGAALSPTSQETIKQSIANASQTTVNNVDLVSVTRTNRRLLSSVVHRMLATVSLFSYKVVAEIHFNLIDFPGLNESYVAGTKSKGLMEAVKTHEFDRIISYYATVNNATQLMSNATVLDISVTTTVVPVPSTEDDSGLSDGQVAGLVVGITVGAILLSGLVYLVLLKVRTKQSADDSVAQYGNVPAAGDGEIAVDVSQIYEERNDHNLS